MTNRRLGMLAAGMWGMQAAFMGPTLALLLVMLYGASASQVGAVVAVYNASGFLASLVIPARADRRNRYLGPLLVSSLLSLGLAVSLLLATSLPIAAIALVALGGPGGTGITLLFAHIMKDGATPSEIVNTRAVFSASWVIGPPIATSLIGWLGGRSVLVVVGVFAALSAVITWWMRVRGGAEGRTRTGVGPDEAPASDPVAGWRSALRPRVLIVAIAFALAQATNTAAVSILSLYITQGLHLPVVWAGVSAGLAAGLEIPALVVLGKLSGRVSSHVLLLCGCAAGIAYYTAMSLTHNVVVLLSLQVLNAWFYATIAGIGLTLFQELIPRPGLANGVFANTGRVGSVTAGALIALADAPWSYSGVYAACAAVMLAAAFAFALAERARLSAAARLSLSAEGPQPSA